MITVEVNGRPTRLSDGATVQTVLGDLELDPQRRGIAVALDAEVVPRSQWPRRALKDGARVEVLTAMQGG